MPHSFETLAIHAGQEPEPVTGAVVAPIFATSTYRQDAVGAPRQGYEYSRTANPTRAALEQCLAALEAGPARPALSSGTACQDTGPAGARPPRRHTRTPRARLRRRRPAARTRR